MQKPTVNNPWVNLNNTVQNLVPNWDISILSSTVYTLTLDPNCVNLEIVASAVPTATVYIKYNTWSDTSNASATNYDDVITLAKLAVQWWRATSTTAVKFFSTAAITLHTIQR